MAYRRRIRRKRVQSMGTWLRGRMIGVLFLVFSVVIVGGLTYLVTIIPDSYIVINNGTITVTSSAPTSGVALNNKLIISGISWGATILLFITGIRRLGLRL